MKADVDLMWNPNPEVYVYFLFGLLDGKLLNIFTQNLMAAIAGATLLMPTNCCEVSVTQLKIGIRASYELQWFDLKRGHQDSSSSNDH